MATSPANGWLGFTVQGPTMYVANGETPVASCGRLMRLPAGVAQPDPALPICHSWTVHAAVHARVTRRGTSVPLVLFEPITPAINWLAAGFVMVPLVTAYAVAVA